MRVIGVRLRVRESNKIRDLSIRAVPRGGGGGHGMSYPPPLILRGAPKKGKRGCHKRGERGEKGENWEEKGKKGDERGK